MLLCWLSELSTDRQLYAAAVNRNPRVVDHALGSNRPDKTVSASATSSDAGCAFQTRNEQGRFSRERGCLCLGTRAGSYAQLLIPSRTRQHSIAEMYSETNDICWKIGLVERSLGIVHGCDSKGTNQSPRSKRTNMHRTQIKATHPNCHARYSCWHSMSTKILSVVEIHRTILSIFAQLQ